MIRRSCTSSRCIRFSWSTFPAQERAVPHIPHLILPLLFPRCYSPLQQVVEIVFPILETIGNLRVWDVRNSGMSFNFKDCFQTEGLRDHCPNCGSCAASPSLTVPRCNIAKLQPNSASDLARCWRRRDGRTIGRCDTWKIYAVLTKLCRSQVGSRRGAVIYSLSTQNFYL